MDEIFFYSSKFIWMVISPDSLFVILFLGTAVLLYLDYNILARRLLIFLLATVVFVSLFPLGSWMLYPLETRFKHNPELPAQIDGIILLGGSIDTETSRTWGQLEMYDSAERLTSFIDLSRRYPKAKLVFTGGNASIDRNKPTEASILKLHLHQFGIDVKRVGFENQAKNTAENAFFTKQLVQPSVDSKWLLVTTAFHMPRSIGVFCQNSWSVIPYPVDHQVTPGNMFEINFNLLGHAGRLKRAMHEWLGLIAYYFTGKIADLVPDGC